MVFEKKFPDLKFFSLKTPVSLISLTGKSLQNFPWFPWPVGTLVFYVLSQVLVVTKLIKEIRFIWGKDIKFEKYFFQVLFSQYQTEWSHFHMSLPFKI